MWMNGYGYGFGGVFMLLFCVFAVAAVVWLVLTIARPGSGAGEGDPARRVLDERLARGEIDVEEYRARRAALDGPRR